jgi:hypothetical protein
MDLFKKFKKKILFFFLFLDEFYKMNTEGLFFTFDNIIINSNIPNFLKNILHSKQILFFFIIFNNLRILYENTNTNINKNIEINTKNNININEIDNLYYSIIIKRILLNLIIFTFAIFILCTFFLKFKNWRAQIIQKNLELENYLKEKRPELKVNQCDICNMTKVMRSFHCIYCNKCISRFEIHSNLFNTCIGSQNYLLYLFTLLTANFYLFFSVFLFIFHIINTYINNNRNKEGNTKNTTNTNIVISNDYDFKLHLAIMHFWFFFMLIITIKIFFYTKKTFKLASKNLTKGESLNIMRTSYLWKNMRKEYFNPFNKGLFGNLKEYYFSLKNNKLEFIKILGFNVNKNPMSISNIIKKKSNKNNNKDDNNNNDNNFYSKLSINENEINSNVNENISLNDNDIDNDFDIDIGNNNNGFDLIEKNDIEAKSFTENNLKNNENMENKEIKTSKKIGFYAKEEENDEENEEKDLKDNIGYDNCNDNNDIKLEINSQNGKLLYNK